MSAALVRNRKRRSPAILSSSHSEGGQPESDILVHYGDQYQALLQTELAVCEALLRRQKAAHGRTRYFQRVRMTLAALKRSKVSEIYPRLVQWVQDTTKISSLSGKLRERDELWSLDQDRGHNQERNSLLLWASSTSVQLLSRLEGCVDVLVVELSRGFFVPLNLTLFALVARFWALIGALRSQVHHSAGKGSGTMLANSREISSKRQNTSGLLLPVRAQQILVSLGIPTDAFEAPSETTNVEKQAPSSSRNLSTGLTLKNVANNDDGNMESSGSQNAILDDEDVGESADKLFVDNSGKQVKSRTSTSNSVPHEQLLDNETSLQNWQQAQKRRKDKLKRKETSAGDGLSAREIKRSKKSKETKITGDFFDDLFG
ncbi:hypothetical protein ACA910_022511 [Epithemia clementina (nom. ined.)]